MTGSGGWHMTVSVERAPPVAHTIQSLNQILGVTVLAGELLLSNGLATSQVERTITALLHACGVAQSQNLVTPTGIHISIEHPALESPLSTLRRVPSRTLNFQRIAMVLAALRRLANGELTVSATELALRRIAQTRNRYPFRLLVPANALVSSSATLLLGGGVLDALVAFASTILVFVALYVLERRGLPTSLGFVFGAALATALAIFVAWLGVPIHITFVIAGGILILAPGAALLASVQDGISGDLISSGSRGLEAFLKGAAIASGIGVALSLAATIGFGQPVLELHGAAWPWLVQILAACISTGSYAVSVQAPLRSVSFAAAVGGACWLVGLSMTHLHGGGIFAAFTAALVAGMLGWRLARWQHLPATVYMLPAIVPFLPGLSICNGMVDLSLNQTVPGLLVLVQALFTGGALAAGVALSDALAPALWRAAPPQF